MQKNCIFRMSVMDAGMSATLSQTEKDNAAVLCSVAQVAQDIDTRCRQIGLRNAIAERYLDQDVWVDLGAGMLEMHRIKSVTFDWGIGSGMTAVFNTNSSVCQSGPCIWVHMTAELRSQWLQAIPRECDPGKSSRCSSANADDANNLAVA